MLAATALRRIDQRVPKAATTAMTQRSCFAIRDEHSRAKDQDAHAQKAGKVAAPLLHAMELGSGWLPSRVHKVKPLNGQPANADVAHVAVGRDLQQFLINRRNNVSHRGGGGGRRRRSQRQALVPHQPPARERSGRCQLSRDLHQRHLCLQVGLVLPASLSRARRGARTRHAGFHRCSCEAATI